MEITAFLMLVAYVATTYAAWYAADWIWWQYLDWILKAARGKARTRKGLKARVPPCPAVEARQHTAQRIRTPWTT